MKKRILISIFWVSIVFCTLNTCSRIRFIGIFNKKQTVATAILKLRTNSQSENQNWFRVKSEYLTNSKRSEFEETIPPEEVLYHEKQGEIILKLSPNYAYFIGVSMRRDTNLINDDYSEIRIESLEGKVIYREQGIRNVFRLDDDCECFLWTLND
ncbi:hypothetical protein [Leptospira santarosai]|uniref:Uncharacterized protein n=1 Tax=Leptospira santarosai serovar Shermani str. LT 821 TaxID=758847 RepID=K8XUP2_9LEPT|nr:hypothetical protein [Leptospira santarosai]EKT85323.1 hypothetical protein LSS_18089 [Leptospira santarosai serovar Shermani str. LT 821]EPG83109.1 hypothetical protein LEP1GSC048_0281 [Leptospira santarosai serovar Shermani str. 1342KT]